MIFKFKTMAENSLLSQGFSMMFYPTKCFILKQLDNLPLLSMSDSQLSCPLMLTYSFMGNWTPTETQEKEMKSCKYVHPNIVSNVKICLDSKSAKENSVIYVCLTGIGHSPEYPTKTSMLDYLSQWIDWCHWRSYYNLYSSFYSTTYSIQ